MQSDPIVGVGWAFVRAGIGLVLFGIGVWAFFIIHSTVREIRARWGEWDTYPIPDKRAVRNIRLLLTHAGVLLFGFGLIVLYVSWVIGWVAWHP